MKVHFKRQIFVYRQIWNAVFFQFIQVCFVSFELGCTPFMYCAEKKYKNTTKSCQYNVKKQGIYA